MVMLTARFHDADAARRVADQLVSGMGAQPNLVMVNPEATRPGAPGDFGAEPDAPTALPTTPALRVDVYDNALDKDAVRDMLERGGGIDIRPIQR